VREVDEFEFQASRDSLMTVLGGRSRNMQPNLSLLGLIDGISVHIEAHVDVGNVMSHKMSDCSGQHSLDAGILPSGML
jgi:hypothetical protein